MGYQYDKPARILINTISLNAPLTGIGRYTLEVCRRMRLEASLNTTYFYGYFSKKLTEPGSRDPLPNVMKITRKILGKFPLLKQMARKIMLLKSGPGNSTYDIYWEPNIVPLTQLIKKAETTIATIHDFSCYHYPEWHPRERIDFFRENFWKGIEKTDLVITGSEYTRQEISEVIGIPWEKIRVIHHGIDHDVFKKYPKEKLLQFAREKGLPERFILFVGTLEPRKNLERLVKAYNDLPGELKDEYRLVIAGGKGWNDHELLKVLRCIKDHVVLTGYLPDHELPLIYNLASAFIYPSLYEGFGLPPVEAMGCGCPVIVSNVTSIPEVCGDAALYFDPEDVESIRENLREMLENEALRKDFAEKGLERAKSYTWERSASMHMEIFREFASSKKQK